MPILSHQGRTQQRVLGDIHLLAVGEPGLQRLSQRHRRKRRMSSGPLSSDRPRLDQRNLTDEVAIAPSNRQPLVDAGQNLPGFEMRLRFVDVARLRREWVVSRLRVFTGLFIL